MPLPFRIETADWMPEGYIVHSPHPVDVNALRLVLILDPDLFRDWLRTCSIIKIEGNPEEEAA